MPQTLFKKVMIISLLLFFLAALVLSLHFRGNSFSVHKRAICKAGISLSETVRKIKTNSLPAISFLRFLSIAICLSLSGIAPGKTDIFIDSQIASVYPNKASPLPS
jgi:hypothetical protein